MRFQYLYFVLPESVPEREEFVYPVQQSQAELQWRNMGYFIMNGTTQENRKLMLQSPNSWMAHVLQVIQGKSTRHFGLEGLELCWELVGQTPDKVNESFLQVLRIVLFFFLVFPCFLYFIRFFPRQLIFLCFYKWHLSN